MRGDEDDGSHRRPQPAATAARNSLAAALGLGRSLAAPFKPISRGWGRQQAGLSEADRKRKLVELAERAVMSSASAATSRSGGGGGGGSGAWHSTTHAEHVRPMLTVSSGPLLEALTYSLALPMATAAAATLQVRGGQGRGRGREALTYSLALLMATAAAATLQVRGGR